jgi:uncharacterized protein YndB with AHSA1/START domain
MTKIDTLPHRVERTLDIEAEREIVFRFLTDTARWAAWWGVGSTIDPRIGGKVLIRYPGGTEAIGEVVELVAPDRLVFTYGYVTGTPIPPGSSLVTFQLEAHGSRTRLRFTHAFAEPGPRDQHVQGWRYQLSLFANVVADELYAGAEDLVDRWFAAWSEADSAAIETRLRALVTTSVRIRDRFSALEGIDDLIAHIAAARRFMPGIRMQREGSVRQCQGMALADWVARAADDQERARGTNVFVFGGGGRIESVTGFWGPGR